MSAKFYATLLYADKKDGKTDQAVFEGVTEMDARSKAWEWAKLRNQEHQRFWITCQAVEPV